MLPHRYRNSNAIWDRIVLPATWHSGSSDIPTFTQTKLVLDLATLEGCTAELNDDLSVVHAVHQDGIPPENGHPSQY